MRQKLSAGLLVYRIHAGELEVFLGHPGGPFYVKQDASIWSIPKGEVKATEDLFTAAQREFEEEIGFQPAGEFLDLGEVQQKSGKIVHTWAVAHASNEDIIVSSNSFTLEWPPHSGQLQNFPEIDRAAFFPVAIALQKIIPAQAEFIRRLQEKLS
jgi:predicted NUDIX family NTP pyrophosphohydrolase